MKVTKKDIEVAILFFAKQYGLGQNYIILMETYIGLPKLIELIVYEIFLNEFDYSYCSKDEERNYDILLEYSKELRKNGFVIFEPS